MAGPQSVWWTSFSKAPMTMGPRHTTACPGSTYTQNSYRTFSGLKGRVFGSWSLLDPYLLYYWIRLRISIADPRVQVGLNFEEKKVVEKPLKSSSFSFFHDKNITTFLYNSSEQFSFVKSQTILNEINWNKSKNYFHAGNKICPRSGSRIQSPPRISTGIHFKIMDPGLDP